MNYQRITLRENNVRSLPVLYPNVELCSHHSTSMIGKIGYSYQTHVEMSKQTIDCGYHSAAFAVVHYSPRMMFVAVHQRIRGNDYKAILK